jgi:hypothetical protein
MEQGLDAMKTALRVLTAITDRHNPEPADVEELRRWAPLLAALPPDELACDVILQVMKQRSGERRATGDS